MSSDRISEHAHDLCICSKKKSAGKMITSLQVFILFPEYNFSLYHFLKFLLSGKIA